MPPTLVPPKEGQTRPPQPPPPQLLVKMEEMKVKQMHLEVEKEKLKVQKLKALKEAQETTGEVRSMLLDLLSEVFASDHTRHGRIGFGSEIDSGQRTSGDHQHDARGRKWK